MTDRSGSPVVALQGVSKVYPGPPPVTAVAGVDLDIWAGDLVAVVGPSGSGKSTLLHLMGVLDVPSSGEIVIDGRSVAGLSDGELSAIRAHRLGFVFQEFFLIDGVTATENVAQGLLYRGLARDVRQSRARRALEAVGLGHRLDHEPARLSGGERQRVAIARALVGEPSVIFADEPTGNLDSVTSSGIIDLLVDLNSTGATIVVITHDLDLADRFPRQVHLRDGRVVMS